MIKYMSAKFLLRKIVDVGMYTGSRGNITNITGNRPGMEEKAMQMKEERKKKEEK